MYSTNWSSSGDWWVQRHTHQSEDAHLSVVWGIHSLWRFVRLIVSRLARRSSTNLSLLDKDLGNFRKLPLAKVIQARGFYTPWWYNFSNVITRADTIAWPRHFSSFLFSYTVQRFALRSPVVIHPWHIIVDGQKNTHPSYTMVSQLHSHHDSSTTTSAHSLIFSFNSLASVSSYPPLSLHATAAVPATPGTAPTVPSLDASRPLTMAESLKSGQGSSLTPAAPSVLDPPASDTTLPSSSNTYFSPKYSLRSTCGADLQCLNIFKATLALRQTIGDFPRLDHSTDKSITHHCVQCLSGGTFPQDDFLTVWPHHSWPPSFLPALSENDH